MLPIQSNPHPLSSSQFITCCAERKMYRAVYNSLDMSFLLISEKNLLVDLMTNPTTSWKTQKKFKQIFINALGNHLLPLATIVCTHPGRITPEVIIPSRFCDALSEDTDELPSMHGVPFLSPHVMKNKYTPFEGTINADLIFRLFHFAKSINIPWSLFEDGCDGRAHLLYMHLISIGIPEAAISKHYAFDDDIGKNFLSPEVEWNYHVATTIKDDNGIEWVFDPSLFVHRPLFLLEWLNIFSDEKKPIAYYHHQCRTHPPSQPIPNVRTLIKIRGNADIDVAQNRRIKLMDHISSDICRYTSFLWVRMAITGDPTLQAVVGDFLASQEYYYDADHDAVLTEMTKKQNDKKIIDANIAIRKIHRYVSAQSRLPPTPQDIMNFDPHLLLSLETIQKTIEDYRKNNITLECPQLRFKQAVQSNLKDTEKWLIKFQQCLVKIKSGGFPSRQVEKMERVITEQIETFREAIQKFQEKVLQLQKIFDKSDDNNLSEDVYEC